MHHLVFVLGLCLWCQEVFADRLVVISPHRKSLPEEFIPAFKAYYARTYGKPLDFQWVDQGGTGDNYRFVKSRFKAHRGQRADIDVFWGGGIINFEDLDRDGFLEPINVSLDLPKPFAPPYLDHESLNPKWQAVSLSSFGILYNLRMLQLEGLKTPELFSDLTKGEFFNLVSATDPRKSGVSYGLMSLILQSEGFEQGWGSLIRVAGNVKHFTHSSSDPQRQVLVAEVCAGLVLDFYGLALVSEYSRGKLGFVVPKDAVILSPDPIGLLKGSLNTLEAGRFIDYLLGLEAQQKLVKKAGTPGGPSRRTLGMMARTPLAYHGPPQDLIALNPLDLGQPVPFDFKAAMRVRKVLIDLLGTYFVDNHEDLKKAWKAILENGLPKLWLEDFIQPPISYKELEALAPQWEQAQIRNSYIKTWRTQAKKRFKRIRAALEPRKKLFG